jgi:hypothetical protein
MCNYESGGDGKEAGMLVLMIGIVKYVVAWSM